LGYAACALAGPYAPLAAAAFSAYLTDIHGGSIVDIYKAFAISYISAGVSYAIGSSQLGFWGRAFAHGVSQGAFSRMSGGTFRSGFIGGFVGSVVAPVMQRVDNGVVSVAMTAVVGGTIARLGGGKFANGAVSAAFVYIFNHMVHAGPQGGGTSNEQNLVVDIIGKIWNLPNTLIGLVFGGIGHVAGWIMGTNPYITIGNNAIQFHNNPFTTAITLGNTISYGTEYPPSRTNYPFDTITGPYSCYRNTVGNEERLHTMQGQVLGPLYLPAHLMGGVVSIFSSPHAAMPAGMLVDPWHRNNFMEIGPMQGSVW
jgi:hypothetical protein